MISEENISRINIYRNRAFIRKILPYSIFLLSFSISYYFNFTYSDDTSLFNDKLIDVSSIFFGVFIGCLYLFEKFRSNSTYTEFLKFCKILLYQNLIIIVLSFIIILINEKLPDEKILIYKHLFIDIKSFIFSLYIAFFSSTIYNVVIFINIILKLLKSIRE